MEQKTVLIILHSVLFFLLGVDCVKVNSENILSDKFIGKINAIQNSWQAGRNFPLDTNLRNFISVDFKRNYELQPVTVSYNASIPLSFDSRKQWPACATIDRLIPQGNCASSYAIVPASIFTDRLCVQKSIIRSSSGDQILSCCKKCGGGCFGGHIESSFKYMYKVGLVSGGGYNSKVGCRPYSLQNCYERVKNKKPCSTVRNKTPSCYYMKCTNGNYKDFSYDSDKMKIKQIYAIPSDVTAIKTEIMNNGPVSSTFTVYEDFFNYKTGVYYHVLGDKVTELDVKIIGWGITKKNIPYWIAVNPWGQGWGEKGLFKIQSNTNESNIESHILAGSFL